MTFGDFWVGMSQNTEKNRFFSVQGGCIHGCLVCLVRMSKTQICASLEIFVCVAAETRYFPICERICETFQLRGGVNVHENVLSVGGMLCWWSCRFCVVSLTWL